MWSSNVADKKAVFVDPNGVLWGVNAVYHPVSKRYLITVRHNTNGGWGIFDAPEPWGPWTTVGYYESSFFGAGNISASTFFWNFSNKWLSADGKTFRLIFTGIGDNDSWNVVRGNFTLGLFTSGFESGDSSDWN